MPPRLSDYSLNDWLHARPLTHAMKTRRYRATDRAFTDMPARVPPPPDLLPSLNDRRVLVTIAFNDPQTVEWQAQLIALYVDDVVHIIADNTRDDAQAVRIAAVAAAQGLAYLRLPANPWNEPSRSHGLALNWVWRNLIRPGAPCVFGFLDDDMYPTAPSDPFAALATQDWFGVVRPEGPAAGKSTPGLGITRWFLWAGFAMYRYAGVRDKPLDFSQDWFLRLDTGGANWDVLYRHVSRDSVREQDTIFVPYKDGLTMEEAPFQWCGTWLHEVGVMGRPEFAQDKRRVVGDILRPHLEKARRLSA
jgi:hypothetical protein